MRRVRILACAALTALGLVAAPGAGRQPPPVPAPELLPPPHAVPVPPPSLVVPARPTPVTVEDFARSFVPAPGRYAVTFIHPKKGCPVTVCFTLPTGCPKVRVGKRELEFDYGCREVEIRFRICGRATVEYH